MTCEGKGAGRFIWRHSPSMLLASRWRRIQLFGTDERSRCFSTPRPSLKLTITPLHTLSHTPPDTCAVNFEALQSSEGGKPSRGPLWHYEAPQDSTLLRVQNEAVRPTHKNSRRTRKEGVEGAKYPAKHSTANVSKLQSAPSRYSPLYGQKNSYLGPCGFGLDRHFL